MYYLRNVRHLSRLGGFFRDIAGTSAVEFGLVAVPFFGLMLTVLETGFMYWTSEGLEASVQKASRNLLTGAAQAAGISTGDQFRTTYLCPSSGQVLPSFIDCTKLIVDVRSVASSTPYTSLAVLDTSSDFTASASSRQFCPGRPGAITIVRVAYPMPVFLPTIVGTSTSTIQMSKSSLASGVPGTTGFTHLLVGTAVFQTEPYDSSAFTPASGC